jgi:uncharacterized membrane protein
MIARRQPTSRDVNIATEEDASYGQRLADSVAQFGGSWTFVLIFVLGLAGWISCNVVMLTELGAAFAPYPFVFLNLNLPMVAALQAPIILSSQNRQANRDRVAAGLDYEINLRSELEIMALHYKLDALQSGAVEKRLQAQQEQFDRILKAVGGAAPA